MRLINTTNSHHKLVEKQLQNTDAVLVEVYSVGNTDVIFSKAPTHYELLISNKYRAIRDVEIETIRTFFLKSKIDQSKVDFENLKTVHSPKIIEISFPIV